MEDEELSKSEPSKSKRSITIHVRHKAHHDLCTMHLPPNSSVRDLKLDVSNRRFWPDIKTKNDIKKIVRPGERVPLWERYVFCEADDGCCFIVVPQPSAASVARKEAEKQRRIALIPPEVRQELDSLSVLVRRLEEQLSELEDVEIDLVVSQRIKRCALDRDCGDVEMADPVVKKTGIDVSEELDALCDFIDAEQLNERLKQDAEDAQLLGLDRGMHTGAETGISTRSSSSSHSNNSSSSFNRGNKKIKIYDDSMAVD